MKPFLSTSFFAAAVLAMPSAAFAQFATDSSAPTIFDADNATTVNGVATFTGQVDIRQGDVRLLAEKVQVFTEGGGNGALISTSDFSRMIATDDFYYITPDQEVRGNKGVYTRANNQFVVTGDVVLLQNDSVVTGNRLDYNLETREARVVGNCKGRKCPRGERVSILVRSSNSAQGTN